ncbi:MAG: GNAT family N-acetyltransferase [bacterium]|nr:GNAT family N-acetyltransferase [bacterium]
MNVTLRQAAPGDSEFAYEVKKAAFREYVERVWGWDEAEQRRLQARRFDAQDVRVVECEGEDVGIVALVVSSECVTLNQLYVLPGRQGEGIGRRCMAMVMEQARCHSKPVRLRVMKVNPRARALYQRLGFTTTGETDTHYEMEAR